MVILFDGGSYLETKTWTTDNGFLTGTEKKRRKLLQAHYTKIQQDLYAQITNRDGEAEGEVDNVSKEFLELLHSVVPIGKTQQKKDTRTILDFHLNTIVVSDIAT